MFVETLREGVKNDLLTKTKGLCNRNFEAIAKKKHYQYLDASLLDTSVQSITTENKAVVEFLPKWQTQDCTKLGPKILRNEVRNGA